MVQTRLDRFKLVEIIVKKKQQPPQLDGLRIALPCGVRENEDEEEGTCCSVHEFKNNDITAEWCLDVEPVPAAANGEFTPVGRWRSAFK